ncbi:hypothetical protein B0H13DRAFT_1894652 [Mycena leptocephala]|nr:hypothetical protein B0H13DRAFT_1894652 [Mycena leptocephala]
MCCCYAEAGSALVLGVRRSGQMMMQHYPGEMHHTPSPRGRQEAAVSERLAAVDHFFGLSSPFLDAGKPRAKVRVIRVPHCIPALRRQGLFAWVESAESVDTTSVHVGRGRPTSTHVAGSADGTTECSACGESYESPLPTRSLASEVEGGYACATIHAVCGWAVHFRPSFLSLLSIPSRTTGATSVHNLCTGTFLEAG